MKRKYRKEETSIIRTFGIRGILAYLTGVIQGYIWGFTGEHRTAKRAGRLLIPAAALVLAAFIIFLPDLGNKAEAKEALMAADGRTPVISLSLRNKEEWCQKNTIFVSAEDRQPLEYRYICISSGEDSGWTAESSKEVNSNGTWMIQVRDAAGNTAEREIAVENIDNKAPVIRSITEKEGETVK